MKVTSRHHPKRGVNPPIRRVRLLYVVLLSFVLLYVFFIVGRSFYRSLFIQAKDRINLVFYGEKTTFYSIGVGGGESYIIVYPADLKVQVPGGYGSYRIGSIGKLVQLDNKIDLYRKTFSLTTSSFIDLYFYPGTQTVYYGNNTDINNDPKVHLRDIMFMNSSAGFFDRVYLFFLFLNSKSDSFTLLKYQDIYKVRDDLFFLDDKFTKQSLGLFYQKTYRVEKKNIQIVYEKSYRTAEHLGRLLEGNGIRVSDITLSQLEDGACRVKESATPFSHTAKDIASFFHCQLVQGQTDIYDIIFEVGEKGKEWEVVETIKD